MSRYDFIVVGAGSAGCVLAARLSEDPANRVLLLEAGGRNRSLFVHMPSAFAQAMSGTRRNWGFETEPEPALDGRRLHCPRGRGLGGSSAINGMVQVRGHPYDFDEWQALGAAGWSFANCLPYFRRAESWNSGANTYRGGEGPLAVGLGNGGRLNPLYPAFIEAGRQAGYGVTADYNGFRQEGFGLMQMTVKDGVRWSTARAYLDPAAGRRNLRIVTGASVERLLLNADALRVRGVRVRLGSERLEIEAGKEVIVCAGAIGSPALLQRSGIGPSDVVREAGIELRHELPGVGENLQDHLEVYLQYRCTQPITLNGKLTLSGKAGIGLQWLLFRNGLGATNHFESCGFIRSRSGVQWPDIQYHFLPAAVRYDGSAPLGGHGFQLHVGPNKPNSRGYVRIASADPETPPRIRFNYLQHEQDRADWRLCLRLSREIVAQPALDEYRGEEIAPGESVKADEDLDAWVRASVESAYHPCGTCRMGAADDSMAVLDAQCRLRGIGGLRVVDASAFPSITNGNLNAPTVMLAERAADLIRGREPLAPTPVSFWAASDWEHRQREGAPARPRDA